MPPRSVTRSAPHSSHTLGDSGSRERFGARVEGSQQRRVPDLDAALRTRGVQVTSPHRSTRHAALPEARTGQEKLPATTWKSEARSPIFSTIQPSKGRGEGSNGIIKEVSMASRSLFRARAPWRARSACVRGVPPSPRPRARTREADAPGRPRQAGPCDQGSSGRCPWTAAASRSWRGRHVTTRAWVSGSLLAGPASSGHGASLPRRPARHRRAPPLTPGPRPTCSVCSRKNVHSSPRADCPFEATLVPPPA